MTIYIIMQLSDIIIHNDVENFAKKAVLISLGKENDYLQRLLVDKLTNNKKNYSNLNFRKLFLKSNNINLINDLNQKIYSSQSSVIYTLSDQSEMSATFNDYYNNKNSNNDKFLVNLRDNQIITSWVINTLLLEKLNYRFVRKRSEIWKNINGIMACVFPLISSIISGLIGYYLFDDNCDCQYDISSVN